MPIPASYYEILGVAEDARQDEINVAYRRLARELPLDADPITLEDEEAQCVLEANAAYTILSNPARRAAYDRERRQGRDRRRKATKAAAQPSPAIGQAKGVPRAAATPISNRTMLLAPIVIGVIVVLFFVFTQGQTPAQETQRGQGLDQKQIAALEQKLKANPRDINSLLDLGNIYLFGGQPASALPYYNRILDVDANNVNAILESGQVHLELGNYAAAEERFKRAQELSPLDAHVLYHWGLFYALKQPLEADKAIAAFQQAILLAPDSEIAKDSQRQIDRLKKP